MKSFLVYRHCDSRYSSEDIVVVQDGMSFYAGAFSVFWCLYYGMWKVVIVLMIASAFGAALGTNIVHLIVSLGMLMFASDIRDFDLRQKGYEIVDVVIAPSIAEAELKYYSQHI